MNGLRRTSNPGGQDGEANNFRQFVGSNRVFVSGGSAPAVGGTPSGLKSRRPDRHCLCAQDRYAMGIFAPGDGLWFGDDLLASSSGLGAGRHLGQHLAGIIGRSRSPGRHRLVCDRRGQLLDKSSFWGAKTGPNPTDRGKNGSKRHLIVDGNGIPLAVDHTAANVHDSNMLLKLVEAIMNLPLERYHFLTLLQT
jgi:hypothetical protein